jgi:hypothetical protein
MFGAGKRGDGPARACAAAAGALAWRPAQSGISHVDLDQIVLRRQVP